MDGPASGEARGTGALLMGRPGLTRHAAHAHLEIDLDPTNCVMFHA